MPSGAPLADDRIALRLGFDALGNDIEPQRLRHAHDPPQHCKVARVLAWLGADAALLDGATFYSDSHNDLPLLERVAHPIAVNADPELARVAAARGWRTLTIGAGQAQQLHARRQAGA